MERRRICDLFSTNPDLQIREGESFVPNVLTKAASRLVYFDCFSAVISRHRKKKLHSFFFYVAKAAFSLPIIPKAKKKKRAQNPKADFLQVLFLVASSTHTRVHLPSFPIIPPPNEAKKSASEKITFTLLFSYSREREHKMQTIFLAFSRHCGRSLSG